MMQFQRFGQRQTRFAAIALVALTLAACDNQDVHQYRVPHESAPTPTAAPESTPHAADAPITYDLPTGWRDTGAANMRIAGFAAGDAADPVQITVTSFGGNMGGVESNVRRWAGQVGAGELTDEQIAQIVKPFEGMVSEATAADITGPNARIYVVFTQRGGAMWFFKMTGPTNAVESQLGAMRQFLSSVRFAEQGGGGAAHE